MVFCGSGWFCFMVGWLILNRWLMGEVLSGVKRYLVIINYLYFNMCDV